MFVDQETYLRDGKKYTRALLRHGYREEGKVKLKTIANISNCTPSEIEAIKIALKSKDDLPRLKDLSESTIENGKFVGSVAAIDQVSQKLGITKALGESEAAKQILWLICARLLEQGSRLSAARVAEQYAVGEILGVKGFCEDNLYQSLDWLYENKDDIEKKLFRHNQKKTGVTPKLFLYDVSSSYFEGTENELAEYGYNRDKKSGKKQIVYGVLTDETGDPLTIQAFPGNTQDPKTFSTQLTIVKERFGCKEVTFVGDKGMIKSAQIENLKEENCHYITTITKPQIEGLVNQGTFQLGLFQDELCEVNIPQEGIRYILRRNSVRAEEIAENREDKIAFIEKKVEIANAHLSLHPKAKRETQEKHLLAHITSRKLGDFLSIKEGDTPDVPFVLVINSDKQKEISKFDGCYAMKTDLTQEQASKETIHDRYKDLIKVEQEFRTQKTGHLEIRSIYLRKKERTVAHLFVTMLAYKIERYLRKAWAEENITVEEGLHSLSRITTIAQNIGKEKIVRIPKADSALERLLKKASVILPTVLPHGAANVITRKKLVRDV